MPMIVDAPSFFADECDQAFRGVPIIGGVDGANFRIGIVITFCDELSSRFADALDLSAQMANRWIAGSEHGEFDAR